MKELKRLLGVRTILTLALTVALIWGFVVGKVDTKDFLVYVTMVYTFFFAKQEIENANKKVEKTDETGGVG